MDVLPHAQRVSALMSEGKRAKAVALHNEYLRKQLDKAKAGETIDLSDLMAAKEILDESRVCDEAVNALNCQP